MPCRESYEKLAPMKVWSSPDEAFGVVPFGVVAIADSELIQIVFIGPHRSDRLDTGSLMIYTVASV
jgi:hypothetical protein